MVGKPNIVLTLDRTVNGQKPVRLAVTLNVWASQDDVDTFSEEDVKDALSAASSVIEAKLLTLFVPPAPACERCQFFESLNGHCRRHPPKPGYGWQRVDADKWCGEFKAKGA